MKIKLSAVALITLSWFVFTFGSQSELNAQRKRTDIKKKTTKKVVKKDTKKKVLNANEDKGKTDKTTANVKDQTKDKPTEIVARRKYWSPEIFIGHSTMVTVGELSPAVPPSVVGVTGSFLMTIPGADWFHRRVDFRFGLQSGFYGINGQREVSVPEYGIYNVSLSSKQTIIPFLMNFQIASRQNFASVYPYFHLMGGGSMISTKILYTGGAEIYSTSAFSMTMAAGLGAIWQPKFFGPVAVSAGLNYMIFFEQVNGNFLEIALRAGVRY